MLFRLAKRFDSRCLVLVQGKLLPQLMQKFLYQKANMCFRINKPLCKIQVTGLSLVSSNILKSRLLFVFFYQVVFHKMSPNETLFLESTNKIYKDDISNSSFVNFQIWDFPGQMDFFDPTFDYEMIFRGTGALIYVIDAQVNANH